MYMYLMHTDSLFIYLFIYLFIILFLFPQQILINWILGSYTFLSFYICAKNLVLVQWPQQFAYAQNKAYFSV